MITLTGSDRRLRKVQADAIGTGTITDDDTAIFTITPVIGSEGGNASVPCLVRQADRIPIPISFSYSGGTATGVPASSITLPTPDGLTAPTTIATRTPFTYPAFTPVSSS